MNDFTVLTHAGMFHADDVMSSATFQLIAARTPLKVVRVAQEDDIPADFEGIIFDIGGGQFDHHRGTDVLHEGTDIPYASFGKVWDVFGEKVIRSLFPSLPADAVEKVSAEFVSTFVLTIDANDNGIFSGDFGISQVIRDFNDKDGSNGAFLAAMTFATYVIERRLSAIVNKMLAEQTILDGLELVNDQVAVLPEYGAFGAIAAAYPSLKMVVYASNRGGWNVNVLSDRTKDGQMVNRFTIPAEASNLEGVLFLHKAGFLLVADTKAHALAAALAVAAN